MVINRVLVCCAGVAALGAAVVSGWSSAALAGRAADGVKLPPADSVPGYVARLLVNETPFPGEKSWVSEADTKAAMLAILCVVDARLRHVPAGYRQEQIAAQTCATPIDVITAGGEKGQCDGFFLDSGGRFVTVPRVEERIESLTKIANTGEPGRFARLLSYASGLASAYVNEGMIGANRFAALEMIDSTPVTGRAYSWMTDHSQYSPGGNFVRIPDADDGSLGGNRFFTLRKVK